MFVAEHMNYLALKDVCCINMGQSPDSKSYNDSKEGIPFFQGNADFGERYPITRVWCNAPTKIAEKDDILISVRAPIGALNYAKETCCIGRGLAAITPNKTKVSTEFIFWLLKGKNNELNSLGTGSTFKAISKKVLEETKVPDISLEKQTAYSNILEKLYFIITHRRTQLEKLDLLVKARFVEMFGDVDLTPQKSEWTTVSEIGTVVGGSTPKTSIEEYWDGDLKWITPAELNLDTGYLYDSIRKITKAGAESCSLQLMPINTVILTSRAPIGKVAIAGTEFYCNQGFKNIICKDTINPRYLYSLLLFNTDYLNSLGRGATFKEISKAIVEKIRIPIPQIELQNQFADFVKQVDKSKVAVQKELDKAQMLFDSLMQEYFG